MIEERLADSAVSMARHANRELPGRRQRKWTPQKHEFDLDHGSENGRMRRICYLAAYLIGPIRLRSRTRSSQRGWRARSGVPLSARRGRLD